MIQNTLFDPLLEVELKIARRADEFARHIRPQSPLNLHCWLLAEAEVLGGVAENVSPAARPATAVEADGLGLRR